MLTKHEVAAMLIGRNATELARRSGVSVKTIQRLRDPDRKGDPNLGTLNKLLSALMAMQAESVATKRKPAKAAA